MQQPLICLQCANKICEKSEIGILNFCDYGVAYFNHDDKIEKKEERITLRDISANLRHELHKVLQSIITDATEIDESLSTKRIDLENPASRIIGATIILDQFIEMITGVHQFHPDRTGNFNYTKKSNLYMLLTKYKDIYSLIRNTRRAKEFKIIIECDEKLVSSMSSNIIENIFSILIDNMWKYSLDNSIATISVYENDEGFLDCTFKNFSKPIIEDTKIFEKGYQVEEKSEGFGYGLYWLRLLISYYNREGTTNEITSNLLAIEHTQKYISDIKAEQIFTLRNIRYET